MKLHTLKIAAILSTAMFATGCDQIKEIAKEEAKIAISEKKEALMEQNQGIIDAAGAVMDTEVVGSAASTLGDLVQSTEGISSEGRDALQAIVDERAASAQEFVDSGIINEHAESFKERALEKKASFLDKASDKLSEMSNQ